MPNKIYAFVGPQGAGKGTMVAQLRSMGIHYITTDTTRIFTKRESKRTELYRTVKKENFAAQDYMSRITYQGEYYGLRKDAIAHALENHRISIAIVDPSAIKQLMKFIKKNLVTIYLMIDQETLVDRMLKMNLTNDEITYNVDYSESNGEFDSWKMTNYVVKNTGRPKDTLEQILAIMGLMTLVPQKDFNSLIDVK